MSTHPRGKLNDTDDGQLGIAIGVHDNTIIVEFNRSVIWIGLDKELAYKFADAIVKHANSLHDDIKC